MDRRARHRAGVRMGCEPFSDPPDWRQNRDLTSAFTRTRPSEPTVSKTV